MDKNETLSDFLNTGTINNKDDENKPYKCYNEKTNTMENCQKGNMKRYKVDLNLPVSTQNKIKYEYHDLFGRAHDDQKDTNFLVSRGYGFIDDYTSNPLDATLISNPFHNSVKVVFVKNVLSLQFKHMNLT